MSESDTPETGPLSVEQAVAKYEASSQETPAPEGEAQPTEAEDEASEPEETVEAEADAETEGEPETEAPEEAGEEDAQTLTLDEYGEVRVQIGEEIATLSEFAERLNKGTLRQADYTRKTTELADQRKALDAREAEIAEKQRQVDAALLEAQGEEPEPDWEKVFEEDPIDGPVKKERWLKEQGQKQRARQEAEARRKTELLNFQQEQTAKLLPLIPEWGEEGGFEKGSARRKAAAERFGFSNDEYETAADPRLIAMLEFAARGFERDEQARVAAKKIASAPKVLKPGAAKASADRKAEEKAAAKRKLSRPHTIDDHLEAKGIT